MRFHLRLALPYRLSGSPNQVDLRAPKMATLSILSCCLPSTSSSNSSLRFNLHCAPRMASVALCLSPLSSSTGEASTVFRFRRQTRVRAGGTSKNEAADESVFMDENGVVDDMDGYLNYLSPEYESVWDTKPSWLAIPFSPFNFLIRRLISVLCSVFAYFDGKVLLSMNVKELELLA